MLYPDYTVFIRLQFHHVLFFISLHLLLTQMYCTNFQTFLILATMKHLLSILSPITFALLDLLSFAILAALLLIVSRLLNLNLITCSSLASFMLLTVLGLLHFIWSPNLLLVIGILAAIIVL